MTSQKDVLTWSPSDRWPFNHDSSVVVFNRFDGRGTRQQSLSLYSKMEDGDVSKDEEEGSDRPIEYIEGYG